jgi:ABC-type amino acid transport substrate-binding protein
MRRVISALVALIFISMGSGARADLSEIRSRGSLRVLVVPVNQEDEFFSSNGGSRPGIDHEILDSFCSLQHLKLAVVPVKGWDALIPALTEGKGDLIAGRFTVTEARKKLIDFTTEVFPTREVVLTRRPHALVDTLEAFREERVGTIKGSSMEEAVIAAGVPRSRIDDSILAGGLPGALKDEKVTAVVLGIESAIAARRDDPDIQLGLLLGRAGSLAYGLRRDESQLLKALNEYIENVRRTATWNRLVVKYFGEQAPEILRKARGE